MTELTYRESILIDASAQALYDLVADITRTGEWSPVCTSCWWDDPATGAVVGARFTGHNELPDRVWDTRSEVVAADPGREFAFVVGGNVARWGYTFAEVEHGTELTESWEFQSGGAPFFREKYGDTADAEIAKRADAARTGIPATLVAIKRIAESS